MIFPYLVFIAFTNSVNASYVADIVSKIFAMCVSLALVLTISRS